MIRRYNLSFSAPFKVVTRTSDDGTYLSRKEARVIFGIVRRLPPECSNLIEGSRTCLARTYDIPDVYFLAFGSVIGSNFLHLAATAPGY